MRQIIGDSHLHTKESDGAYSVAEVINFAIEKKLSYICFTDHYPLPPEMSKKETFGFSELYIKEIEDAGKNFAGVIDICLGGEFDWLEDHAQWTAKEISKRNYDYILGSIHYIFHNGKCCLIDAGEEAFHEAVKIWGGIENVVTEYYRQLRLMVRSGLFNGVGHFDLVKIYNRSEILFSEESPWYKDAVIETLEVLSRSKMCLEINTNGWYKTCSVQYPSFWILKEACKRGIPVTLSSDGHRDDGIGRDLLKASELAGSAGYSSTVRFKERKMIEFPLPNSR